METIRTMSLIIILGLIGMTFLGLAIRIVEAVRTGRGPSFWPADQDEGTRLQPDRSDRRPGELRGIYE